MPHPIVATVSDIKKDGAILRVTASKKIVVPPDYLPSDAQKGDTIVVEILSEAQHKARQKDIAQAVLSEILGSSPKDNGSTQNT